MNKKKKILLITNSLYGGGAEKVLETLIKNINKEKYDITIYTLHKTKILEGTYQDIDIKYFFLENHFLGKIHNKICVYLYEKHPKLFYKRFFRKKYDVEIAFIEGYATKIVASSSRNSRKIAWIHTNLKTNRWTGIAFQNFDEEVKCYETFDTVVCVSEDVSNAFKDCYGIYSDVRVVYNPIDEKTIVEKSKKIIELKKHNNIQFVSVGRLEYEKGYDRLLNVINKLKNEGYDFNVWLIGTGTKKEEFMKYISNNHLEQYISLLGYKANPYPYISNADIFISTSRSEGFSTVVTEALILGKPVLTTNCSGMTEIFGENNCGIIFNNNEEEIYKYMKKILDKKISCDIFIKHILNRKNDFVLKNRMIEIEGLIDE